MIFVWLTGGVGNQMFQYAFGRRVSLELGVPFKLDVGRYTGKYYRGKYFRHYSLGHFAIRAEIAQHKEVALLYHDRRLWAGVYNWIQARLPIYRRLFVKEARAFEFDPTILQIRKHVYLKGYWQTYRWFEPIADLIREEFAVVSEPDAENREMARQIGSTNAVSLHIRRGDYVTRPSASARFGTLPLDYYHRAVAKIAGLVASPHFFVFSDDPDWGQENLRLDYPATFVRHNGDARDYEDLRLMSLCQHHIIANSSFSWWGAWLGCNPNKQVVAPARWYLGIERATPELLPETWHRL